MEKKIANASRLGTLQSQWLYQFSLLSQPFGLPRRIKLLGLPIIIKDREK